MAWADRVEILDQAVSDAPGQATFFSTNQEGFSRLGAPNAIAPQAASLTVPVTTIDAFCGSRGLTPDWITLDIEGYEIAALEGARQAIAKGRGRLGLIVEMHPAIWPEPNGPQRMANLLRSLALRPIAFSGQPDPLSSYGVVLLEYV